MIKVDVELIRFGILVDGCDMYLRIIQNGSPSDVVAHELIEHLKVANKLVWDFPSKVHDDIMSGRFTKRLLRY